MVSLRNPFLERVHRRPLSLFLSVLRVAQCHLVMSLSCGSDKSSPLCLYLSFLYLEAGVSSHPEANVCLMVYIFFFCLPDYWGGELGLKHSPWTVWTWKLPSPLPPSGPVLLKSMSTRAHVPTVELSNSIRYLHIIAYYCMAWHGCRKKKKKKKKSAAEFLMNGEPSVFIAATHMLQQC